MPTALNAIVLERIEVSLSRIIVPVAPDGWELPEINADQNAVLGLSGEAPGCKLAMLEESVQAIHQHVRPGFPESPRPEVGATR